MKCFSRQLNQLLHTCPFFWRHLVHNEEYEHYTCLAKDEVKKIRRVVSLIRGSLLYDDVPLQVAKEDDRVCWGGGNLHELNLPASATKWEKVFKKGVAMRSNLVNSRLNISLSFSVICELLCLSLFCLFVSSKS